MQFVSGIQRSKSEFIIDGKLRDLLTRDVYDNPALVAAGAAPSKFNPPRLSSGTHGFRPEDIDCEATIELASRCCIM